MSVTNERKITKLLDLHQPGTVLLASWLKGNGISYTLQHSYVRNGWLVDFGVGAFKRPHENITWRGGLQAIQHQKHLMIHAGALTALSLAGLVHYARTANEMIFLFSPPRNLLPAWFKQALWEHPIHHVQTTLFPDQVGLTAYEDRTFEFTISTPERAILEYLHLAPKTLDLVEGYQIMEGLVNLRPDLVQELLEKCTSIKAKRLFLYMAHKAGHQWFQFLETKKLDVGTGNRHLAKDGVYIAAFKLTVPKELQDL